MHVLCFGLHSKCLLCFVLRKYSLNHPYANESAKDDKWARDHGWISNGVLHFCFWRYIFSYRVAGTV